MPPRALPPTSLPVAIETIPPRIETANLVVRRWREADAALLRAAIDSSLDHLRAWMPWAMQEPASLDDTRARLAGYATAFDGGEDFVVGLFDREESAVVGGAGLHRRIVEGGLELGYWIRADRVRRGFATEAAHALTNAGLSLAAIHRIQIHCDPHNVASRRIPERLGYRLIEIRRSDTTTPAGFPRDTAVFERTTTISLAMPITSVRVVPWDPRWPEQFEAEREELLPLFGDAAAAIHHVGSTSVPGLAAKPVLDVLVETPRLRLVDAITPSLEARGYEARGEYGIPGRRYFSRAPGVGLKVHLHVFVVGHPYAASHLLFRDFLRSHPSDAAQYGELKTRLASEHSDDPASYQRAKAHLLEALLEKARAG